MKKITTVGLDLAKSVFQVHGIAEEGVVIVRRALRRSQVLDFFRTLQPCLVGWKPVVARIIGRGKFRPWGIRFG